MARIWSHSALEAFLCEARGLDAMKVRYGKSGPARQGQAGHTFAEKYLTHLNKVERDTDHDIAAEIWSTLKAQISADDERAVGDAVERFYKDQAFPWVASASDLNAESQVFVTVPDRRVVPAERVHLITGPVFRVTVDLTWRGHGPMPIGDDDQKHALDWKWHRVIEHVSSPEVNRQLRRYCAVLIGDDPSMVAWLGFPRSAYYEHAVFEADELAEAWRDLVVLPIEAAEKRIERAAEVPDRCVGAHCRHCDMRRDCDAALRYPFDLPMLEGVTTTEKATAFTLITALRKDYATSIKNEIDEGALVDDDDIEAGIKETEYLSYKRADLDRVLGDHLPPDAIGDAVRATKSSVERVLKANGVKKDVREELLAELRATADREVRTKLDVRTKKKPRAAAADAGDGEDGSA